MNLNVAINFNQLKSLIAQCGIEEKTEIVQMLEKDTFPFRFHRLMNKIRKTDISPEEITAEVEAVRETRYRAEK